MNTPTAQQNRIMNVAGEHGVRTQWNQDGTVTAFVEYVKDGEIEGIEEVKVSTVLELKIQALGYCCHSC